MYSINNNYDLNEYSHGTRTRTRNATPRTYTHPPAHAPMHPHTLTHPHTDVRCIFQPPLNNGRLTIRFNSYALFICEHRYTAEGWFIPGITNFDQPEPDIQQITQSNVTCLHNSTAACDRIIIIYIPTSTEHQNKTTQICTHINGTKHCSQEFAVQLNQGTCSVRTL